MTIAGSVDQRSFGSVRAFNEQFTSLFKFFSGPKAATLGIQRVAYNIGATATGIGYWDETLRFGSNAWGLWRFLSASNPFYLLLQYSEPTIAFGASPGSPGLAANSANTAGNLAWSVAMLENGASPWNGTTNNNGADTKGATVWVPGASALRCWPRSNNPSGSHTSLKQNMMPLNYTGIDWATAGVRMHVLANHENVLFLQSTFASEAYVLSWFGKYTPVTNNASASLPYAAISGLWTQNLLYYFTNAGAAQTLGSTAGAYATGLDGGVSVNSGSQNNVVGMVLDTARSSFFPFMHPNRMIDSPLNVPYYDVNTIFLGANESPFFGILGYITFFGITQGVGPNCMNTDKLQTSINGGQGGVSTVNNGPVYTNWAQWIVPWDGLTVPGTGNYRYGRQFSRAG